MLHYVRAAARVRVTGPGGRLPEAAGGLFFPPLFPARIPVELLLSQTTTPNNSRRVRGTPASLRADEQWRLRTASACFASRVAEFPFRLFLPGTQIKGVLGPDSAAGTSLAFCGSAWEGTAAAWLEHSSALRPSPSSKQESWSLRLKVIQSQQVKVRLLSLHAEAEAPPPEQQNEGERSERKRSSGGISSGIG